MEKEKKLKVTAILIIAIVIVLGMYHLFIVHIGEKDYFYQVKDNKIILAEGFCWKRSVTPIKKEAYIITSFKIPQVNGQDEFMVDFFGRYELSMDKSSIDILFSRIPELSTNPLYYVKDSIKNDCSYRPQDAINDAIIAIIAKKIVRLNQQFIMRENAKISVAAAMNELLPKEGVAFLKIDLIKVR